MPKQESEKKPKQELEEKTSLTASPEKENKRHNVKKQALGQNTKR